MSLFKTENCPICGEPTGALSKSSAKYNKMYVCQTCSKIMAQNQVNLLKLKKYSLEELQSIACVEQRKQRKELQLKAAQQFHATKSISSYVQFDDDSKIFAILSGVWKGKIYIAYADLLDYELLEDGNSISKGGIGRALVGGVLFGGVGAIVGGVTGHKQKKTCTNLQIKLTLNDLSNPVEYINFITTETKKDGIVYKSAARSAQEVMSAFNVVCQSQNESVIDVNRLPNATSAADEIMKFKELLDKNIITQEEFEAKKKQLLGL